MTFEVHHARLQDKIAIANTTGCNRRCVFGCHDISLYHVLLRLRVYAAIQSSQARRLASSRLCEKPPHNSQVVQKLCFQCSEHKCSIVTTKRTSVSIRMPQRTMLDNAMERWRPLLHINNMRTRVKCTRRALRQSLIILNSGISFASLANTPSRVPRCSPQ